MINAMKTIILNNGMKVNFYQKAEFKTFYAQITVNFGAKNLSFLNEKKETIVFPAGIAHFFEHKIFEKKEGDIFATFSHFGANSNAWTNYDQTNYYFNSIQDNNIEKNLSLLLDLVYIPYFTKEANAKEQGIIGQEISMYDDIPEAQLEYGLLKNAFPMQPLSWDIAGDKKSISEISPEMLYEIHKYFYQPSNLTMSIVGDLNINALSKQLNNLIEKYPVNKIEYHPINLFDSDKPIIEYGFKKMNVSRPLTGVMFKISTNFQNKKEAIKFSIASRIILELLFGESSDWYQKQYEAKLIDPDFGISTEISKEYGYILFFSKINKNDQQFKQLILERLKQTKNTISILEIKLKLKSMLGDEIRHLDDISNITRTNLEGY
ncbi:MAG: insulinase family protein, partial [Lactobacillaceae bacterium]|nr:insulinase family protein [Lactobacillaceae bacterium]